MPERMHFIDGVELPERHGALRRQRVGHAADAQHRPGTLQHPQQLEVRLQRMRLPCIYVAHL